MPTPDRPNVVVVMTDQQRADWCAREGFPLDTTPFVDDIAEEGRWFDRAYTPVPLCGPARTCFLSGQYPTTTRVWDNDVTPADLDADLFSELGAAGYATALSGKNHSPLGPADADGWFELDHAGPNDPDPEEEAFVEWMDDLFHGVATEPTPFPPERQGPHLAVSNALDWIDSVGDRPFFCWLSVPEPHSPYQVPEPYFDMFPPSELPPVEVGEAARAAKGFDWEWLREVGEHVQPDYADLIPRMRSNYCGMLRFIDDQLRRFVEGLAERGLREETLLVVTSDHGEFAGEYGLVRKGPGLPEVLTRVPLVVDGPGVEPREGADDAHVSLVDLFPTVLEAAGAPVPEPCRGRSLWPVLSTDSPPEGAFGSVYAERGVGGRPMGPGDDPDPAEHTFADERGVTFSELNPVTQSGRSCMVRRGRWKLVADVTGDVRLYDLDADPRELDDVSAERPETRADLLGELAAWSLRVREPAPSGLHDVPPPARERW
jgi:arylsulfatase A-like enzyme